MKLVQACLCAKKTLQPRFNCRGGDLKHVQACLRSSKDGESIFHHCKSPVKLVQACLWAGNTLQRHLNRLKMSCEARGGLFKCQLKSRNQFSPLWKSCEARKRLCMC